MGFARCLKRRVGGGSMRQMLDANRPAPPLLSPPTIFPAFSLFFTPTFRRIAPSSLPRIFPATICDCDCETLIATVGLPLDSRIATSRAFTPNSRFVFFV